MVCNKCGSQIPDGSNVCPNCGSPVEAANAGQQYQQYQQAPQQPYQQQFQQAPYQQQQQFQQAPQMYPKNTAGTIATICGILSIVVAILGGIMFGIIGAGLGVVLGVVAVVEGMNAKKATANTQGSAGFICGILGLVFGVIFAAGCGICGCTENRGVTGTSYTCYGCVGGSCMARNDVNDAYEDLYDSLDSWY